MAVSNIKKTIFSMLFLASFNLCASIDNQAMNVKNVQMVNLNLQIKSKNNTVKSDLVMPFYQTAEFERTLGDKNIYIELSPKRGKNSNEINLEMRFYRAAGLKAFYKKEIVAKVNEVSSLSFRGMSVKIKPALNLYN